jgi:uncharacterized protein
LPQGSGWRRVGHNDIRQASCGAFDAGQSGHTEMQNIWDAVGRFFGSSHNDRCQELLGDLSKLMVASAGHMTKTLGKDLPGIIDYERKADRVVDEIHELLDNSFIMRFDIADMMKLSDELDNVVDGMRKVAMHSDIFKAQLSDLRPDARELMVVSERMVKRLSQLIAMLGDKRLKVTEVRIGVRELDDMESEADALHAAAVRRLVTEYSPPGANRLEYIAWDKLYQLLEDTTDHCNHCGNLILSLARKEA